MSKDYKIFSEQEEIKLIKNRYKNLKGKIPFTIERLKASDRFMNQLLPQLRVKYPDWLIYQTIWTLTFNYRANLNKSGSLDDWKAKMISKMKEIEKKDDTEVPISEYNMQNFEKTFDLNILALSRSPKTGQGA